MARFLGLLLVLGLLACCNQAPPPTTNRATPAVTFHSWDLAMVLSAEETISRERLAALAPITDEAGQVLRVVLIMNDDSPARRRELLAALFRCARGDAEPLARDLQARLQQFFEGDELKTRLAEVAHAQRTPRTANPAPGGLNCPGIDQLPLRVVLGGASAAETEQAFQQFARSGATAEACALVWTCATDPQRRAQLVQQLRTQEEHRQRWKRLLESRCVHMSQRERKIRQSELEELWGTETSRRR